MKTTRNSLFLAALVGFLAGCAAMWLIWPRRTAASALNQSQPQATQIQSVNAVKSPKSNNTQARPSPRRTREREVLNEIKRRNLANVDIRFFESSVMGDGKLSQQFIALFGLSPEEAAQLSGLIRTTKAELLKAAKSQAHASYPAPGEIVVEFPPVEAGPDIYDKVMDGFRSVLGEDRFQDMMLYNGNIIGGQFENLFRQFGGEKRTIVFKKDTGNIYDIKDYEVTSGMSGWRGSRLSLDGIKQFFPECVDFIPTE